MTKCAAIVAILLTLITGMILGQLRLVAGSRVAAPPTSLQTSPDTQLAAAFYESLNQVIRTGDVSGVYAKVTPSFVDNSPYQPASGTAESLVRYFRGLHTVAPNAVLEVEDVTADGKLIAIRLKITGVGDLTIAGLPVQSPTAESFELLRIEGGRVAERWAGALLSAFGESLGEIDIRYDADMLREPRLEKLVFPPGAELNINDHQGTILRVEAGVVMFAAAAPTTYQAGNDASPTAEESVVLPAGDSVSIQPMRSFLIRNTGRELATLVWLSIREVESQVDPSAPNNHFDAGNSIGVSLLAGGVPIRPGQGPFDVVIDRMVAPPGTSIPLHTTGEFEMLLVESGTADVAIQEMFVLGVTDDGALKMQKHSFRLEAGDGIAAPSAAELEYLTASDETTVVWVITVRK